MASDLLSTIRLELDARLDELRPFLAEYERLLAADASLLSPDRSPSPGALEQTSEVARAPRPQGVARLAILAALEHGSHTVSELTVVTAMSGPNIRKNLRGLLQERAVRKISREGKTAYAPARRI
jgi:DNA-binding transcriptional ArsR family regulator